jgi:hypothetical protein
MKNFIFVIILSISYFCFSQKADIACKSLRKGVFNIYEGDSIVGKVYRENNVQIEKYPNKNRLHYVRMTNNGCRYTLEKYFINENEPLDTLKLDVRYELVKNNFYKYHISTRGVNFTMEGFIKKISNSIPKEFKEKFKELSKLDQD